MAGLTPRDEQTVVFALWGIPATAVLVLVLSQVDDLPSFGEMHESLIRLGWFGLAAGVVVGVLAVKVWWG